MWKIDSPNKELEITITTDEHGALAYIIKKNNREVGFGKLGIRTSLADFTDGLSYVKNQKTQINENYAIPVGKKDIYENHANEAVLSFTKESFPFDLVVRAYDNGAAFRYKINVTHDDPFDVINETTSFEFPEAFDQLWLQEWMAQYEAPYNKTTWQDENHEQHFGMPALIYSKTDQLWVMINEANVLNTAGNYCVSHLLGTKDRCLHLEFAPEEKGLPVASTLPFQSPWRYLLVEETLDGVVNATLNYNLNPPSVIEDTSWIKPSRAVWAWWSSDMGAASFTEAKAYVDFAKAMGFEAVVLDDDWDITWIKTFCDYAHEHGIQPWLWTAMQTIDTYERANHYLPLWKSWGIVGVKIDIFENDSAYTAGQYHMMAEMMKDLKLMVNFHGNNKPMGEGRTWPHFVTGEGIMGLEYYKWSEMPNALHNCTVPFIRNAVGPMDYTPVGFINENRNTSMAHQMALAAVYESGSTHYGASIFALEPWHGTDFLRRLKPKYDGLKLLSGFPGDHTAMLRWVNETEEFIIGCICNEKRTLRIYFDFLPEGEFEAETYVDDRFGEGIITEKITVTKDSFLDVAMVEHGGAGIYITRKIAALSTDAFDHYMKLPMIEIAATDMRPFLGSEQTELSEGQQGLMLNGGGEFYFDHIPVAKPYTFRITYCNDQWFTLQLSDGKTTVSKRLPPSGPKTVFAVADIVMLLQGGPSTVWMTLLEGKAPFISKIEIKDNVTWAVTRLPVETGVLMGGGYLKKHLLNDYKIMGMPTGGILKYPNVTVARDGKYVIRINYEAGITGTAEISVNGNPPVRAHLSGVNLFRRAKVGDIIVREVMVTLKKGRNDIALMAKNSLPPILELEVIADF